VGAGPTPASATDGRVPRVRTQPASALVRLLDNPEFFQALEMHRQATLDARFADCNTLITERREEADEFYNVVLPPQLSAEARPVARLSREVQAAVGRPDVKARLLELNLVDCSNHVQNLDI